MSLIIEIENPNENSEAKFYRTMELLAKATKVDFKLHNHSKSEPTPYKSLRQLADGISEDVEKRLYLLWREIVTKWLQVEVRKASGDDEEIKLDGRILIDPKSGKRLTKAQWKKIQKQLTDAFKYIYGDTNDALLRRAVALGRIVQQLDPNKRTTTPYAKLPVEQEAGAVDQKKIYDNILDYGDIHTGDLITDITNRNRRAVSELIMNGYRDGMTPRQLRDSLFDEFSTLNRDWRRIAETETAINFNNGYLQTELDETEEERVFMIGISGAGACEFCASQINDNVVVLLENPPASGDTVVVEGTSYTAIWPGKNNFGRKRANWWISAGNQHPHCRCTWTRYYPEVERYASKLRAATGT